MRLRRRMTSAAIAVAFAVFPALTEARSAVQETTTGQSAAAPAVDTAAAAAHLGKARQALAGVTALPAAAQLTGDARMWTQSLITNFNQLLTTKTDWTRDFAKVQHALDKLLAADAAPIPADQPVGTSGTSASVLDPAVKSKLEEMRTHLAAFYAAAGSPALEPVESAAPSSPPEEPAAPPSAPEAPAPPPPPAAPEEPAAASVPPEPPAPPMQPAKSSVSTHLVPDSPAPAASATGAATAKTTVTVADATPATNQLQQHLDEIAAIVNGALASSDPAITMERSKLEAIRTHLDGIRTLMANGKN